MASSSTSTPWGAAHASTHDVSAFGANPNNIQSFSASPLGEGGQFSQAQAYTSSMPSSDPRQTAYGYAPPGAGGGSGPSFPSQAPPGAAGALGYPSSSLGNTIFNSTDTLGSKTIGTSQFPPTTATHLPSAFTSMPPLMTTPRSLLEAHKTEDPTAVQGIRHRWRLRNRVGNFGPGGSLEELSREKAIIQQKASLPLQLGLSFEVPFLIVYVIWTLIATIYKNQALPHNPEGIDRGAEEVILLFLYFVIQPCRLRIGSWGNRCENGIGLAAFIFLTFVTLFIHGYFLTVQVYVLKCDFIFNIIGMSVQILCVLCAFYVSIIAIGPGQNREFAFVLGSLSLCVFAVLFVLLYNWKQTKVVVPCPIDGSLQCQTISYGPPLS